MKVKTFAFFIIFTSIVIKDIGKYCKKGNSPLVNNKLVNNFCKCTGSIECMNEVDLIKLVKLNSGVPSSMSKYSSIINSEKYCEGTVKKDCYQFERASKIFVYFQLLANLIIFSICCNVPFA